MQFQRPLRAIILLLAATLPFSTTSTTAGVIDSFDTASVATNAHFGGLASPGITNGPGQWKYTVDAGPISAMIGGPRQAQFGYYSARTNGTQTAVVQNGQLTVGLNGTDPNAFHYAYIYYNGSFDFSGVNTINVDVDLATSQPNANTWLEVYIQDNYYGSWLNQQIVSPGPQTLNFNLADFYNANDVNLSSLQYLGVYFYNMPGHVTLNLQEIYTNGIGSAAAAPVPEPASMAVWSVLAMAGYGARRKLARAKA